MWVWAVLFLVSNTCATLCRFCTRKRRVGDLKKTITSAEVMEGIEYIKAHKEIRDVIISGGDPLLLSDELIEKYLKAGYVKVHQKIPPYTHKLEFLCQLVGLHPPEEIMDIIIRVDKYYIAARYPTYKESVNITQKRVADEVFTGTKGVSLWLCQEFGFKK